MNDYQYINENGSPRDYYEIVNENGELCKEIERLKQDNEYLNKVNIELSSRNTKVIEYIKENDNKEPWKSLNGKELLEILDKEKENG